MARTPFSDSESRIQFAYQKLYALRNELVPWVKREICSTTQKIDASTGESVIEIVDVESIPPHWPLVASEISLHLRSALDNAIHHLSVEKTGGPVRGSQFPVYLVEKEFKANETRLVGGVDPRFLPFIEQCQPFRNAKPDESPLWGLHETANADKHQQLPLLVVLKEVDKLDLREFGGIKTANVKRGNPGPLKFGTEIARWRVVTVVNTGYVTVNFAFTRDVVLDVSRPPCLANKPLIATLDEMGKEAAKIIDGMKNLHESWKKADGPPLNDFAI